LLEGKMIEYPLEVEVYVRALAILTGNCLTEKSNELGVLDEVLVDVVVVVVVVFEDIVGV
jgi:hypothetical protein